MPREFSRSKRVADQVQRELAVMIQREQGVAGLSLVTISAVDLSPDMLNAKVFVTSLGTDPGKQEVLATLNDMAGHFRHLLSKKLATRTVPRLSFVYDYSVERGTYLSALIDSVTRDKQDK
jgi:ribosome-binding factor A